MSEEQNVETKSIDDIIKEADDKFIETFEKVRRDASEALKYNEADGLDIQLIKCHSAAMRFNDIHVREKHLYHKFKAKYERMYAEMIDVAKQNPLMYRTSNEIDGFIIRDTKIARAKSILQNQLELVEYLQSVMELLKSKRFDLKTLVEIRKTETGRQF
jgi:hypothetical protein